MAARVASGTNVTPRLVRAIDGVPQEITPPLAPLEISPKNLAAVRGGMYAVSNSQGGTAYRSRIADPAMEMAGKTGTSQVRNITAAERARGVFRNEDLPWERRDHALFVCFAPYAAPRYSVAVVVEHGGGGSLAAAPIARDILLRTLRGPDLANYPSSERSRMEELFRAVPVRGHAPGSGGGSDRA
jgi:penicillin-binding protein 2